MVARKGLEPQCPLFLAHWAGLAPSPSAASVFWKMLCNVGLLGIAWPPELLQQCLVYDSPNS